MVDCGSHGCPSYGMVSKPHGKLLAREVTKRISKVLRGGGGCAVDALVFSFVLFLQVMRHLHVRHLTKGSGMGSCSGCSTAFAVTGSSFEPQLSRQVGPAIVENCMGPAVWWHGWSYVGMARFFDLDKHRYAPLVP